jgi:hypothetical protein
VHSAPLLVLARAPPRPGPRVPEPPASRRSAWRNLAAERRRDVRSARRTSPRSAGGMSDPRGARRPRSAGGMTDPRGSCRRESAGGRRGPRGSPRREAPRGCGVRAAHPASAGGMRGPRGAPPAKRRRGDRSARLMPPRKRRREARSAWPFATTTRTAHIPQRGRPPGRPAAVRAYPGDPAGTMFWFSRKRFVGS